jgi:16S rRNA processing protein RimM
MDTDKDIVILGHLAGAHGVKGWVKVYSETSPIDNILQYSPWYLESRQGSDQWRRVELISGRRQGKGIVAQIQGCDDRDQAAEMRGIRIAVHTDQLPALDSDEYYWRDLIGLEVVNQQGTSLGRVSSLMETGGSNDVQVVDGDRERLIPYLPGNSVIEVDTDLKRILVDWDEDF